MRGLSLILCLFGVVALLTLGTGGAWAAAATDGGMACHDTGGQTGHPMAMSDDAPSPAPAPSPSKSRMVMACCVACVSPALPSAPVVVAAAHPRPTQPARFDMPHGRIPSPEPGPPRHRS